MQISQLLQRAQFRLRLHVRLRAAWRRGVLRAQGAAIGSGTSIPRHSITWPHQLAVGANCILEDDIFFKFDGAWAPGPSIVIRDRVFIGRGCEFNIRKRIVVGVDALISSGCRFIDHDHGVPSREELIGPAPGPEEPICVEANAWLGANTVILKGVTIGAGAVVGAGAIVTKSVPAYEIWAGVPARKIGERPRSQNAGIASLLPPVAVGIPCE